MLDVPTWNAILHQWPWFAGALAVFVIAVGLLIFLNQNSKQQPKTAGADPDKTGWISTGRIDFADSRAVGELVLQMEESRSTLGLTGLEHREIRWRRATLEEAKKVLQTYNAQRNLAMSPTFTVSGTKPAGDGDDERRDNASRNETANAEDLSEATLIPQDAEAAPIRPTDRGR